MGHQSTFALAALGWLLCPRIHCNDHDQERPKETKVAQTDITNKFNLWALFPATVCTLPVIVNPFELAHAPLDPACFDSESLPWQHHSPCLDMQPIGNL